MSNYACGKRGDGATIVASIPLTSADATTVVFEE